MWSNRAQLLTVSVFISKLNTCKRQTLLVFVGEMTLDCTRLVLSPKSSIRITLWKILPSFTHAYGNLNKKEINNNKKSFLQFWETIRYKFRFFFKFASCNSVLFLFFMQLVYILQFYFCFYVLCNSEFSCNCFLFLM